MKFDKRKIIEKFPFSLKGFVGIFTAVMFLFIIMPVFMDNFYAFLGYQFCFVLTILSTIYVLRNSRKILFWGIALVFPYMLFVLLGLFQNSLILLAIGYIFFCIYIAGAIFLLSKEVIEVPFIDTNIIFGVITIYFLAGIFWGKLYFVVDTFHPGSFGGIIKLNPSDTIQAGYLNQYDLLYYSYTVLTTLGLGDISPIHHLAKSLTVLEAMFGQLFLATVIAKIVAFWKKE
ncbi:MAG: two pore domain potassium channel family protein [Parachlamydiaceae bacterium]|nr:two pore domain potassium channel family protein [Parachlamydiaceae bacterium]